MKINIKLFTMTNIMIFWKNFTQRLFENLKIYKNKLSFNIFTIIPIFYWYYHSLNKYMRAKNIRYCLLYCCVFKKTFHLQFISNNISPIISNDFIFIVWTLINLCSLKRIFQWVETSYYTKNEWLVLSRLMNDFNYWHSKSSRTISNSILNTFNILLATPADFFDF